jgi:hypothetical protein
MAKPRCRNCKIRSSYRLESADSDEVGMGPEPRATERDFFRRPLLEQIKLKHPLVRLAGLIDRVCLGKAMSESVVSCAGQTRRFPQSPCDRSRLRTSRNNPGHLDVNVPVSRL